MSANIYVRLTGELNAGRVRAIISSGQAVVLHRFAIVSNPKLRGLPLRQAHERMAAAAQGVLPEVPDGLPA